jgi:hypothetical protein
VLRRILQSNVGWLVVGWLVGSVRASVVASMSHTSTFPRGRVGFVGREIALQNNVVVVVVKPTSF